VFEYSAEYEHLQKGQREHKPRGTLYFGQYYVYDNTHQKFKSRNISEMKSQTTSYMFIDDVLV